MMPDWDAALEQALDLHRGGRLDEAAEIYRRLAADRPNEPAVAAIYNNLGQIHKARRDPDQAIVCYRRAVAIAPDFADAHNNLGNALIGTGASEEAIACYRRALAVEPDHLLARYNLATNLIGGGPPRAALEEAAALLEAVIAARPGFADAYNNLGWCWLELGRSPLAARCFEQAIALQPDHADAYTNLGRALLELGDPAAAEGAFRRAVEIRPSALALTNLGTVLRAAGRIEEARRWHERALEDDPENGEALASLVYACLHLCDWPAAARAGAALDRATQQSLARGRRPSEPPFLNIVRHAEPSLNRAVAEAWSRGIAPNPAAPGPDGARARPAARPPRDGRIVIAYLSSDLGKHVVGHIMTAILPRHDRARFRILGFSHGPEESSDERRLLAAACDRFVDVRSLDAEAIARRMRDEAVDILVDLNGYTQGRRLAVAAHRPAPVQILHLYVGTVGGGLFDYVVADPIALPEIDLPHCAERPIYLPHCFLPGERRPAPASEERESARIAEGLPADAIVLCSFNQPYKFDSETFAAWLELLKRRRDAVLWLSPMPAGTTENLRRYAASHGVDGQRLVVARWRPRAEHLARLALADLALDTATYGGHQTTCDALCAGVPVIARRGRHFASRIATSLVMAAGVPELAAESLAASAALAGDLMERPERLRDFRMRLAGAPAPLFDPSAYVRSLEDGFRQAFERHMRGMPPTAIFARDPTAAV